MTALILVVDDIESNVRILEAKLTKKYYQVITASCGKDAISIAKEKQPDVILLDVMMPEMDGFEACRRLKKDYVTMHIPVIIVTALTDIDNKIEGLGCGADEFLIKPVKDFALFTRIKSLVRFKNILDELRLRLSTHSKTTQIVEGKIVKYVEDIKTSRIGIVDDQQEQFNELSNVLSDTFCNVEQIKSNEECCEGLDAVIINISITKKLLSFYSVLKSKVSTRLIPVIAIIDDEDDKDLIDEIMEIGISDYIAIPINGNELIARLTTHVKRKKYQDAIKMHMENNLKMAIIDPLTLLYNRYYFESYANQLMQVAKVQNRTFSLFILDIDYFKAVNDSYGHLSGDLALKQVATILKENLRLSDLVARFGGEEIVAVLSDLSLSEAIEIAERIRLAIQNHEFMTTSEQDIRLTVSIGVAQLKDDKNLESLLYRADKKLYLAKQGGRNCVMS